MGRLASPSQGLFSAGLGGAAWTWHVRAKLRPPGTRIVRPFRLYWRVATGVSKVEGRVCRSPPQTLGAAVRFLALKLVAQSAGS